MADHARTRHANPSGIRGAARAAMLLALLAGGPARAQETREPRAGAPHPARAHEPHPARAHEPRPARGQEPRAGTPRTPGAARGPTREDRATKRLTLEAAIRLAERHNDVLRGARLGVRSARAARRQAWTGLGPRVSASVGLSFLGGDNAFSQTLDPSSSGGGGLDPSALCPDPATAAECGAWMAANAGYTAQVVGASLGGLSDLGAIQSSDSAQISLGLLWPLFRYPALLAVKRSTLGVQRARAALRDGQQDVRTRVVATFYNLLAAQEALRVARSTAEISQRHLGEAQALRAVGKAVAVDTLRWRSQVARDQQQVIEADQAVRNAQTRLSYLIGRPLGSRGAAMAVLPPPALRQGRLPPPGPTARIRSDHPQLQLARLSLSTARLGRKQAIGAFLPSLDLSAGYRWTRYLPYESLADRIGWMGSWSVGLTLTVSIFESGTRVFALRQADLEIRRAKALARDATRRLQVSLLEADRLVRAQWSSLVAARTELAAAAAAHGRATRLYRAGAARTTDVLDAQRALAAARYGLLRARYGYLIARAQRARAQGTARQGAPR